MVVCFCRRNIRFRCVFAVQFNYRKHERADRSMKPDANSNTIRAQLMTLN